MPFARIDIVEGKSPEYIRTIGDVIYDAMIETLNVPKDDRFQIITEHPADMHVADKTYLGIERTTMIFGGLPNKTAAMRAQDAEGLERG